MFMLVMIKRTVVQRMIRAARFIVSAFIGFSV